MTPYVYVLNSTKRVLPYMDAFLWNRLAAIIAARAVELKAQLADEYFLLGRHPEDAEVERYASNTQQEYLGLLKQLEDLCKK